MDDATRREIEKVTWQTLRDAGLTEPSISLDALLEHLELFREFYDLQNPGFLDNVSLHKSCVLQRSSQMNVKFSVNRAGLRQLEREMAKNIKKAVKRKLPVGARVADGDAEKIAR